MLRVGHQKHRFDLSVQLLVHTNHLAQILMLTRQNLIILSHQNAQRENIMSDLSVNISGYTNQHGTSDVMIGDDQFAYAVRAESALRKGKKIADVTSNDVREFMSICDNHAYGDKNGKTDRGEILGYALNEEREYNTRVTIESNKKGFIDGIIDELKDITKNNQNSKEEDRQFLYNSLTSSYPNPAYITEETLSLPSLKIIEDAYGAFVAVSSSNGVSWSGKHYDSGIVGAFKKYEAQVTK